MKKIILALIVIIAVSSSCTKNFEDFNTDKKHATEVPGGFLFANAQKRLADQVADVNVNRNIWNLISQYWTECTYTDESNYDIVNRTIPDNMFQYYYRDILSDIKNAKTLLEAEEAVGDVAIAEKQNRLFIIDIVEVYCYQQLVDIFGDVPYTEAVDVDNISPAYDDGLTIYKDLLARLDADIAGLDGVYGSFGGNDVYFFGDVSMWMKFAYTMKVRLGIALADVDEATGRAAVESAYQNAFAEGELCELHYETGTFSNPKHQELVLSGRNDFLPTTNLVDHMNELNDPRRPAYFNINGDTYRGSAYGYGASFGSFSHVADAIQEPDFPGTMLDYTELAFYLAEASARGWSVGGSVEEWYNKGILSSMDYWGISETDAQAYLEQASVAYGSAPGTWQQKIALQAWLAFYLRGLEGWNTYRRLDWPPMDLPETPETDPPQVPTRFTYPINEQTLNKDSYYAAADAIGGDNMVTKLFWDKY